MDTSFTVNGKSREELVGNYVHEGRRWRTSKSLLLTVDGGDPDWLRLAPAYPSVYCRGMESFAGIDLDAVRAFLGRKAEARRERLERSLEIAQADFDRIARHVFEKYPVTRIWQWGSLVERRHFSEISDIDLGLEGVSSPQMFSAILDDAIKMTDFPLDIIELEKIEPADAHRIRRRGRLVHERT